MAGSCECGNEPSASTKCEEFSGRTLLDTFIIIIIIAIIIKDLEVQGG
jgi:hypothetical protein